MFQCKGRDRKIQVAILGGAFNPCTVGHIKLAEFVLNTSKWADEVWLCPAYKHMDGKIMESHEHRLEMLKLATQNDGRIKVFDYEIKHQMHGETFCFLNKLIHDKDYENYKFGFILGMDRANNISSWYNSEELLKMDITFIVVTRNGVKRDELVNWYLQSPHIYIQDEGEDDNVAISSTKVRDLLHSQNELVGMNRSVIENSLLKFVSQDVANYLLKNELYQK